MSQENKLLPPYPPHLKNVTTLPCKMHNLTEDMLLSSKRWWLWEKPVVDWHWWVWEEPVVICGKWNVTQAALQQMFKVTTFCTDTCFQSFLPLINCIVHHALLKFSLCHNASTTRPYHGLVLNTRENTKKMKHLCILQGNAVTFFRCGGKRVTICFLLG